MDWTDEDTEVMTIANRICQVICKRDPAGYRDLMDPERQRVQRLSTKVGDFELFLYWKGDVTIIARDSDVRSREVFRCGPPQAKSRPNFRWNKRVVQEEVIPALDAEMVLDDLSLL